MDEECFKCSIAQWLHVSSHSPNRVGATFGVWEIGGKRVDLWHAIALDLTRSALPEKWGYAYLVDENLTGASLQALAKTTR
jgi:cbb3-type cytochrome oxidase cytochrome c subunit